jgi:hypothetical protein
MARYMIGVVVLTCVVPRTAAAQRHFEGTITYDVGGGDRQVQMVISARGKKVRQDARRDDMPEVSRGNYVIVDYDRNEVTSVVPAMKRYMVMDFKRIRAAIGEVDPASSPVQQLAEDVVATGRKERIAGVECAVYLVKSAPGNEWCITTELGGVLGFDGSAGAGGKDGGALPMPTNAATTAVMRTFKNGALILRMQATDKAGRTNTLVASKIDRTVPSASLFAIPTDFEEVVNPMVGRP